MKGEAGRVLGGGRFAGLVRVQIPEITFGTLRSVGNAGVYVRVTKFYIFWSFTRTKCPGKCMGRPKVLFLLIAIRIGCPGKCRGSNQNSHFILYPNVGPEPVIRANPRSTNNFRWRRAVLTSTFRAAAYSLACAVPTDASH